MFTPEQIQWSKDYLKDIMSNDKTRYKALIAEPEKLNALENALLVISQAKKESYEKSAKGVDIDWELDFNSEKSKASLLLQQNFVSESDIPMLPHSANQKNI